MKPHDLTDLDPIFDSFELTFDCEEPKRLCQLCGELASRLYTIDDEDRSVGYREEMDVCGECLEAIAYEGNMVQRWE